MVGKRGAAGDEPVLDVTGLSVRLGGRELVTDVSLSARAGECVALVGESGSGKTLTCRAMLGSLGRINATVAGSVKIRGQEMATADSRAWRQVRGSVIGLVPQSSMAGLDPIMRVGHQLAETIKLHDRGVERGRRTLELLEQVEIVDPERVRSSYPHQLSGGMRQRVMIALALAGRPEILVADEPTTALDVTVERAILDLLARLSSDHDMALVLVSHDLALVGSIADRVHVMYAGTEVESGPAEPVLTTPGHPYTDALIAADPAATPSGGSLAGIPGSVSDPSTWTAACRFADRCTHAVEECRTTPLQLESIGSARRVRCLRREEWR